MPDRPRWMLSASLALNLLLVALCLALVNQNRVLKRGGTHAATSLRPGTHLATFAYRTLDGRRAELRYDRPGRQHLLFVVSTTCSYCERSLPRFAAIARWLGERQVDPMAVSIDDVAATASFAAEHASGLTVVSAESSDDFQRRYGVAGVPTTILVDGQGVVRNVWEGDVTDQVVKDIQSVLARS